MRVEEEEERKKKLGEQRRILRDEARGWLDGVGGAGESDEEEKKSRKRKGKAKKEEVEGSSEEEDEKPKKKKKVRLRFSLFVSSRRRICAMLMRWRVGESCGTGRRDGGRWRRSGEDDSKSFQICVRLSFSPHSSLTPSLSSRPYQR